MAIFLVRMEHPDGPAWNTHVLEHVRYLQQLINQGRLLASGPITGARLRAGFLIMLATNREEAEAMIEADPFHREGLISDLSIEAWDPLFGQLGAYSSQRYPEELKALVHDQ